MVLIGFRLGGLNGFDWVCDGKPLEKMRRIREVRDFEKLEILIWRGGAVGFCEGMRRPHVTPFLKNLKIPFFYFLKNRITHVAHIN